MARNCPIHRKAVSVDCAECDSKPCRRKYKTLVIGVDQSYKRTGISIAGDGRLLKVSSIAFKGSESRSKAREQLQGVLTRIIELNRSKAVTMLVIVERVRQFSHGHISMAYISSMERMTGAIVDACAKFEIPVYSVDTRCWKSQVLGSSKPFENDYGVKPEKWLCVEWVIEKGFEKSIKKRVEGRREKGVFRDSRNRKFEYDDDAADSAAIAMYFFKGDRERLKLES